MVIEAPYESRTFVIDAPATVNDVRREFPDAKAVHILPTGFVQVEYDDGVDSYRANDRDVGVPEYWWGDHEYGYELDDRVRF
jgi:hypothetical protein